MSELIKRGPEPVVPHKCDFPYVGSGLNDNRIGDVRRCGECGKYATLTTDYDGWTSWAYSDEHGCVNYRIVRTGHWWNPDYVKEYICEEK